MNAVDVLTHARELVAAGHKPGGMVEHPDGWGLMAAFEAGEEKTDADLETTLAASDALRGACGTDRVWVWDRTRSQAEALEALDRAIDAASAA